MVFDYGYSVDSPIKFPMLPSKIDALFCSHAHLDHIGMVPLVRKTQSECKIFTSPMTREVGRVLLKDSVKVFRLNQEPYLYGKQDVNDLFNMTSDMDPSRTKNFRGIEFRYYDAGHVPGAMMTHVISDSCNFLFTGDMNLRGSNITDGAKIPHESVDTLFIEGTYGDRNQEERSKVKERMFAKIDEAISNGGRAIIPSFAFGRSQDIMVDLAEKFDVTLDGLSNKILDVFLEHGRETIPRIDRIESCTRKTNRITHYQKRHDAMKNAQVVITTGGMLEGGPVLGYLDRIFDDRNSKILLTGFQGEGTNGRLLSETGSMYLNGDLRKFQGEVVETRQSAHSDLESLLRFIRKVSPREVVIMHSESSEEFKRNIQEMDSSIEVRVPIIGKEYINDM
jgi:putative mRNA 3-end processing factor